MKLKVLSSGSHGNSYILDSPTGSLLIEAGIPWRQILQGLNYDLSKVVGCLVTHEHKDHSKAVADVMKAGIDCYMSQGTIDALSIPINSNYRAIPAREGFQIDFGDFTVKSFKVEHDASDPRGFLIQYRPTKEKLLFLTDSYYSRYKFSGLNYICIECNYIKETLDQNIADGYIPLEHKPRLLRSHMSLENLKSFLKANDLSSCSEILILHLSSRNSDQGRMIREIEEVTGITPKIADKGLSVNLQLYPY